jgi:hypothetical protein
MIYNLFQANSHKVGVVDILCTNCSLKQVTNAVCAVFANCDAPYGPVAEEECKFSFDST